MNQKYTPHVHDHELYMLMDGEMDPEVQQTVNTHLSECTLCAERMAELRDFSLTVREAAPQPAEFSSDGAFWIRLAGHLGDQVPASRKREKRPWLRLIPSFGLAVLGFVVDGLVTLALIAYTLIGLGVLPSVGSQLLQSMLIDSGLILVLQKLGITDAANLHANLANLASVGISQDALALFGVLLVLCLILLVVIGLLFVWNAPRVAAEDQDTRGVNVHAVR